MAVFLTAQWGVVRKNESFALFVPCSRRALGLGVRARCSSRLGIREMMFDVSPFPVR